MTITQEKVEDLKSLVKINLKKEDYEPQVKKQLKALAKNVQLKGFRPGMVPTDMVKKMYGNSVLAEELNKVLNDEIYKYLDENKIDIIASPIPAPDQRLDLDINGLKDIDFAYEVGLAPQIDLGYIENAAPFTKNKIAITDAMIDDEVMRIRQRYSTYEYPETVGAKDVLTFTIEELDNTGNVKEGGVSTVSTLMVDLLKEDARAKVLPLKKQESFEYNVFDLMDRDRESMAKNVLNMNDPEKISSVGDKFRLTLNNITRSKPADINDEFFAKVYGDGGAKNEEEMRNNIKADLEAYFDGRTDTVLVNDIYKGVLEHIDFPLPDEFLKRWIGVTNEKPITPDELEKDYPQFAKSLRWSLVQRKIVREQNIEVTEAEVLDRVRANVFQQMYSYGLRNIGEEWVEQFVQKQMADKKVIQQTREQVLEDKVLGWIKGKVKLSEKEVSLDEFKALIEQQK